MDLLHLQSDDQQFAALKVLTPDSTPFPLRAPHRFSHGPSPLSRSAREEGFRAPAGSSSPQDYLLPFQPTSPNCWKELCVPLPRSEDAIKREYSPFSAFFTLARLCARSDHLQPMDLCIPFPTVDNGYDDEKGRFVDDDVDEVDRMDLDEYYPVSFNAGPFPVWSVPFDKPGKVVLERRKKSPQGGAWLCQRRWDLLHYLTPKLFDHIQGMVERKTRGGLLDTDVDILASYQSLPADLRAALDPGMVICRLVRILNTTLGGVPHQDTVKGRIASSTFPNDVLSSIPPPLVEIGNQVEFKRERRISFSKLYNLPALNIMNEQRRPFQSPRARDTLEFEAERDLTYRWFNSMTSRREPIDMRKQAMVLRWKRSVWSWDDIGLCVS